jgi:hypothetical protein
MKCSILLTIFITVLGASQAFAETLQPVLNTPEPIAASAGSPGTATPTPQPGPPKEDEPLPGLQPATKPNP